METPWKVLGLTTSLLFLELCNGFPINLENSGPDSQAQFLTGLVAVLLAVCSVVLLVGCLCCQRKKGFKEFRDSPVVASVASNLDHGHVNPISGGEFTIFTPISPPHHNNNVFLANQRIVSRAQEDYKYGDIDVTSWFDGTESDFPRTRLKYIRELGKGWFGRVVEGTAQGLSHDPNESEWTPVVVRILEASATSRDRVLFLHDATIYRCGRHANILQIFGRSLDTVPLLLLQEYCVQGDVKRYLRDSDESEKFLSSDLPLLWSYQLTTAVKYLHDRKITHPDLAARNCQLTNDLSLKLGDYGLSATFYPEDYYQGSPGVPLRWCAPETVSYTSTTIQSKKMTMEANVWSLGVTMWEIFDFGEQPYSWLTDDEVISQVLGSPKVRLPRPTYNLIYTDYIYRLMQSCWSTSESRPIISHVDLILADLMQVVQNVKHTDRIEATASIQDFDKRWESLKPNALAKPDNDYLDTSEALNDRRFSASLNNLHGSLDNLLERRPDPMESWLENVASDTGDMSYVHGLSQAIKDLDNAIALENVSSDSSHQPSPVPDTTKQSKLQFKLGQLGRVFKGKYSDLEQEEDSILYVHRTSSESETEDETWKKKIERGVYTEKVRQKSRSVADLMILTHIDCSESDSETMPSLDYKVNCNGKLRHDNLKFGSEGNLLSVKGTFQDELKKLQEERRDSLLFVPDKFSQSSFSDANYANRSPVKKLIDELNSPSEMVPPQQVYNVFNVSVNQKYPVRRISGELEPSRGKNKSDVNLKSVPNENQNGFNLNVNSLISSDIPKKDGDGATSDDARFNEVTHEYNDSCLEDQENTSLLEASSKQNRCPIGSLRKEFCEISLLSDEDHREDVTRVKNSNESQQHKKWSQGENEKNLVVKNFPTDVPKLSQIIQSNVELSGYIMSNQSNENEVKLKTDDAKHNLNVTVIDKDSGLNTPENSASLEKLDDEDETQHFDFNKMYETSRSRNFPGEDNEDASCNASFDSDRSNLMTSDDVKDNKMESTDEEIGDLRDESEGQFEVLVKRNFGANEVINCGEEDAVPQTFEEFVAFNQDRNDDDANEFLNEMKMRTLGTRLGEDVVQRNVYVPTIDNNEGGIKSEVISLETRTATPVTVQSDVEERDDFTENKSNAVRKNVEAINLVENYDHKNEREPVSDRTNIFLVSQRAKSQLDTTKEFLNYEILNYKDVEIVAFRTAPPANVELRNWGTNRIERDEKNVSDLQINNEVEKNDDFTENKSRDVDAIDQNKFPINPRLPVDFSKPCETSFETLKYDFVQTDRSTKNLRGEKANAITDVKDSRSEETRTGAKNRDEKRCQIADELKRTSWVDDDEHISDGYDVCESELKERVSLVLSGEDHISDDCDLIVESELKRWVSCADVENQIVDDTQSLIDASRIDAIDEVTLPTELDESAVVNESLQNNFEENGCEEKLICPSEEKTCTGRVTSPNEQEFLVRATKKIANIDEALNLIDNENTDSVETKIGCVEDFDDERDVNESLRSQATEEKIINTKETIDNKDPINFEGERDANERLRCAESEKKIVNMEDTFNLIDNKDLVDLEDEGGLNERLRSAEIETDEEIVNTNDTFNPIDNKDPIDLEVESGVKESLRNKEPEETIADTKRTFNLIGGKDPVDFDVERDVNEPLRSAAPEETIINTKDTFNNKDPIDFDGERNANESLRSSEPEEKIINTKDNFNLIDIEDPVNFANERDATEPFRSKFQEETHTKDSNLIENIDPVDLDDERHVNKRSTSEEKILNTKDTFNLIDNNDPVDFAAPEKVSNERIDVNNSFESDFEFLQRSSQDTTNNDELITVDVSTDSIQEFLNREIDDALSEIVTKRSALGEETLMDNEHTSLEMNDEVPDRRIETSQPVDVKNLVCALDRRSIDNYVTCQSDEDMKNFVTLKTDDVKTVDLTAVASVPNHFEQFDELVHATKLNLIDDGDDETIKGFPLREEKENLMEKCYVNISDRGEVKKDIVGNDYDVCVRSGENKRNELICRCVDDGNDKSQENVDDIIKLKDERSLDVANVAKIAQDIVDEIVQTLMEFVNDDDNCNPSTENVEDCESRDESPRSARLIFDEPENKFDESNVVVDDTLIGATKKVVPTEFPNLTRLDATYDVLIEEIDEFDRRIGNKSSVEHDGFFTESVEDPSIKPFDKTGDFLIDEIADSRQTDNDEKRQNLFDNLNGDAMQNYDCARNQKEAKLGAITSSDDESTNEQNDFVSVTKCRRRTHSNLTQERNCVGDESIDGADRNRLIAFDLINACDEFLKNEDAAQILLEGKTYDDLLKARKDDRDDELLRNEVVADDVAPTSHTIIIDDANVNEENVSLNDDRNVKMDELPVESYKITEMKTVANYPDVVLIKKPNAFVTKEFLRNEILNYGDVIVDFETKIFDALNETNARTHEIQSDRSKSEIEPESEANFEIEIPQTTGDFLSNEISRYDSVKNAPVFDLSANQEEISPNSLTRFTSFTSTPFVKRSMESSVILGASDDYSIDFYSGLKTTVDEAEDLKFSSNFVQDFEKSAVAQKLFDDKKEKRKNDHSDLYSLETWDNFLRKSFDDQDNRMGFDNFNEEPHSLLFLDNYGDKCGNAEDDERNKILSGDDFNATKVLNETYNASVNDKTYDVDETVVGNETFTKPKTKSNDESRELEAKGGWETSGGWFLHPQSNTEVPTGQMVVSQESVAGGETYVGFSMDDEIMAAIRNELMTKLPHAQRASSDHVQDTEELDSSEKNEVFVRYNVYNTPLSPIPEESYVETDESGLISPRDESVDDDSSDWSMQDNNSLIVFTETLSPRIPDSPAKSHLHPHTPSQDSCCSNDTLFNLEELTNANDHERLLAEAVKTTESNKTSEESPQNSATEEPMKHLLEVPKINVKSFITEFLNNERYDQINSSVVLSELQREENDEVSTASDIYLTVSDNTFSFGQSVAPLNSPEDRPWKELQASFRSCEFGDCDENQKEATDDTISNLDLIEGCGGEILEDDAAKCSVDDCENVSNYETATEHSMDTSKRPELNGDYANGDSQDCSECPFESVDEKFDRFEDMYGPLADIRFSGPCSIQLMTTSFNEGNDLGEEQDWDSGSDSRSSSSGEFIWRNVEDVMPMEDIQEENESSCSSGSECPEFVPSAWDKYATPTKSSLRSPEKTVERAERNEKNPRGVWFKKQKYHCVYEYPREPDSPVLQSYDLWKPTPDFATLTDWDLDTETYLPTLDEPDFVAPEPKIEKVQNLYQLTTFSDVNTAPTMLDEDFFINGSSRPFDMLGGLTSQFFPGKLTENWNENVTPDSGVEDVTPGSAIDAIEYKETTTNEVESLKNLAAAIAKQSGNKNVELGGLRHTRNKLKLDLPPSPSAFTSSRSFNVELAEEIVHRQVPTFSTFGKSRFLVQHVDTPPDDHLAKNVSFEALPYKPAKQFVRDDFDKERHKIEVVRGEASLLDSADEDSGIDSCTLERKRGVEG